MGTLSILNTGTDSMHLQTGNRPPSDPVTSDRQQAGGHWTVKVRVNRCWVVALVSAAQYLLIQHGNIYLHKPSIYYQRLHF